MNFKQKLKEYSNTINFFFFGVVAGLFAWGMVGLHYVILLSWYQIITLDVLGTATNINYNVFFMFLGSSFVVPMIILFSGLHHLSNWYPFTFKGLKKELFKPKELKRSRVSRWRW